MSIYVSDVVDFKETDQEETTSYYLTGINFIFNYYKDKCYK